MEKNNRNISRREALKRIGRLAAVATVAGSMPTALLADERLIAYSSFSNRVAHQAATQAKPNTQTATRSKSGAASTSTQSSSSQIRRDNTTSGVSGRQHSSNSSNNSNSSSGSTKSTPGKQSRYPSYISYNSYR